MRLDELNQASVDEFVEQLGGIFEHSPWVAERVAAQRPFASVDALHAVMCAAVASADENLQMALICAHPQLAGVPFAVLVRQTTAGRGEHGLRDVVLRDSWRADGILDERTTWRRT